MKEGIFINGRQIQLRYSGANIELDLSAAKQAAQAIHHAVEEVESLLEEDRLLWRVVHDLDAALRREAEVWWLEFLTLRQGEYVAEKEFNQWDLLWSSIVNSENVSIIALWDKGCFDSLLRTDNSLKSHLNNPKMSLRLRNFSESMQWVEAGEFIMGDDSVDSWDFEGPRRTVQLTSGFWMGCVPVTQHLYECVMGKLSDEISDRDRGPLCPMIQVSWWQTLLFCNNLSRLSKRNPVYWYDGKVLESLPINPQIELLDLKIENGYRLPTEAEWECSARAWQGKATYSGGSQPLEIGWMELDESSDLPLVQQKKSNLLGLYDMSGLIWEWCWDGYDPDFYKTSLPVDPVNNTGTHRVCRGGSFFADRSNSRLSMRGRCLDQTRWRGLGFRLVCFE